ncbi:FecR family protein [Pedobacter sp. L105]|uniref:FecR family protein n=1 Tax=Pedobacter sp. L105 TaxID=1641871 RepID=UPI00131A672A|nr:FecR family protein [Pedobacter sp. L105]
MSQKKENSLFDRYKNGAATEEEKALVEKWLINFNEEPVEFSDEHLEKISQEVWAKLPHQEVTKVRRFPIVKRLAIAASILIAISAGTYFIQRKPATQPQQVSNIEQGRNQATLILANGKKIILKQGLNGALAQQGQTSITANNERIVYSAGQQQETKNFYNTLTTARGEKSPYPLVLADGTKVWLNAESSLSFPVAFSGRERLVRLTGEAYFEVEHNAMQPFKVQTNKQTIEDIGTSFNVNAYADEPKSVTTLIEGSVKVNNAILKPNEQTDGDKISRVNTGQFIAWKNNDFDFEGDRIEAVMRQLSRWYNIEVVWDGPVTDNVFYATLTMQHPITKVLKILEKTEGVHFKVEGRRVIVSR